MNHLFEHIKSVLKQNKKYCKEGKLFKNIIVEDALKVKEELLSLLLSDDKAIKHFFTEVGKVLVFDKIKFQKFVSNKQFLPDSYTAFKNKIDLTVNSCYLTESREVVLDFPYKDCILEGGQSKEEQKKKEIFWNRTLAPDEIDRLLEPKALSNFKRYDSNGEIPLKNISLDDNYLIKGNNLLALYSLKKVYSGKIKLIYIDPPYNTGSDGFNYNDSFNHSAWLTFMKNRLEVAKELLNDDGIIYISCDDRENSYLKVLCDSIFGRDKFITNLIWRKKAGGGNDSQDIAVEHEYILAYRKKNNGIYKMPLDKETISSYKLSDTKANIYGKYKTKNLNDTSLSDSKGLHYDIVCPDNSILKGNKNQWKCNKETFESRLKDGRIVFKKVKKKWCVHYKIYLNEEKGKLRFDNNGKVIQKGRNLSSILYNTALNKDGSNDIKKLFNGSKPFAYPKPVKLLETLILSATKEDDIVLDFFAGSGTTAEAVIKINSINNSNRKFILVEQMDYIESVTTKRVSNSLKFYKVSSNFVFFSLAYLNNELCLSIVNAKNKQAIFKIYEGFIKIKNLNYKLNTLPIKEDLNSLDLIDLKQTLLSFLDMNNLYISLYDMDDNDYKNYNINNEYSTSFYNL